MIKFPGTRLAVQQIYELSPTDLRRTITNLGRERTTLSTKLWDALMYRASVCRKVMNITDLTHVFVGFAKSGQRDSLFQGALLKECQEKVDSFGISDGTALLNALHLLKYAHKDFLDQHLGPVLVRKLSATATLGDLALLSFCLSEGRTWRNTRQSCQGSLVVEELRVRIAHLVLMAQKRLCNPQTLSTLVYGFAFAEAREEAPANPTQLNLLETLVAKLPSRIHECSEEDLLCVARCLPVLPEDWQPGLPALLEAEILKRIPIFRSKDLVYLLGSPLFFQGRPKFFEELEYRIREVSSQSACQLLLNFGHEFSRDRLALFCVRLASAPCESAETNQKHSGVQLDVSKAGDPLDLQQILEVARWSLDFPHWEVSEMMLSLLLRIKELSRRTDADCRVLIQLLDTYAKLKIRDTTWIHVLGHPHLKVQHLDLPHLILMLGGCASLNLMKLVADLFLFDLVDNAFEDPQLEMDVMGAALVLKAATILSLLHPAQVFRVANACQFLENRWANAENPAVRDALTFFMLSPLGWQTASPALKDQWLQAVRPFTQPETLFGLQWWADLEDPEDPSEPPPSPPLNHPWASNLPVALYRSRIKIVYGPEDYYFYSPNLQSNQQKRKKHLLSAQKYAQLKVLRSLGLCVSCEFDS